MGKESFPDTKNNYKVGNESMESITKILEIVSFLLPVIAAVALIAYKLISKKEFSNKSGLIFAGIVFGAIAVFQFSPLVGLAGNVLFPQLVSLGLLTIPAGALYITVIASAMYILLRPTVWLFFVTYGVLTGDNGEKKNILHTIGDFGRVVVELTILALVVYGIRNLLYIPLVIETEHFFEPLFLVSGVLEAILIKAAIVVAYFFVRKVLIPNSK